MSFRLLQLCNDMDCAMSSTDHAVLMVLCRYADDAGKNCFPSVAEIARCSHFTENPVRKALSSLCDSGWIAADQRPGRRRYFALNVQRIRESQPLANVQPLADVEGVADQHENPLQIDSSTPCRSGRGKEQEEKKQKNTSTRTQALETYGISDALISDWRSSLKRPLTQTALDGLKREADIAGISAAEAIRVQLERGWGYFDGAKYKASLASVPAAPAAEPAPAPTASKKESSGDPDELTRQYLAQHRVGNVSSIAPWREQTEDDRRAAAAQAEEREANTFFRTLGSASAASAKEAAC